MKNLNKFNTALNPHIMTKLYLTQEFKVGLTFQKSINTVHHINRIFLKKSYDQINAEKHLKESSFFHHKNYQKI